MKINIHILVFLLIFTISYGAYACQQNDYIALRALYLNTDGDNWTNNTNWPTANEFTANPTMPTGTDMNTWYGVTTNNAGCATIVDIWNNQLSGSIPNQIGNLNNLTYLNMRSNQLSGNIPTQIGNLNNLMHLNISRNQLSGSIPTQIGNLSSLAHLYLGVNQLSGGIRVEIGNLSSLTLLDLGNNQLSGSIPAEIGNLNNLTYLYLGNNQLSGSIPAEIGNLSSLILSNLQNNQLSGSIPAEIGNLNSLTRLFLYNNQLTGCYDSNLMSLCTQLNSDSNINTRISDGNNFDASWEDFCAIGPAACFLPIEQSEPLKVYIENRSAILTWETTTETNNSGFEIQRSKDGINWEKIGWQAGQGTITTPHPYTYRDANPLSGTSYYRLKQVDFDGQFDYSNIVSLLYDKPEGITVYPIPAKDVVTFDVPNIAAADDIILYDITGREISRQAFPQDKQLVVSHLNDGVYIYRIFYEHEVYSGKIVVE